jgi:hypothetical protein
VSLNRRHLSLGLMAWLSVVCWACSDAVIESPDPECVLTQSFCTENALTACIDGFWAPQGPCEEGTVCHQGACVPCDPGAQVCGGDTSVEVWSCPLDGGAAAFTMLCADGMECYEGFCVNPCSPDIKVTSNVGCAYYAVDLENSDAVVDEISASASQFAVIVSNPDTYRPVTITVTDPVDASTRDFTLEAGTLQVIPMPRRDVKGTMRGALSYAIEGTRPFVAYQFNPLDNTQPVYSNDASLLLPASVGGTDFLAVTGRQAAWIVVVATRDATDVTVTPSGPTDAGIGVPAAGPDTPMYVTMDAGEVLALRAREVLDGEGDLTGSVVISSQPVLAFAGNEATATSDACCADHLEQQLVPTSKWGTTYVAARSHRRGVAPDYWRVIAARDGTTVTFTPAVSEPVLLARGEWIELVTDESFVVEATGPVMLAQLLASSHEILVQGKRCEMDADCPSGQRCDRPSDQALGVCYAGCAMSRSDCPAPGHGCQFIFDWLQLPWTDTPLSSAGFCAPRGCEVGGTPCDVGAECFEGIADGGQSLCFDTCSGGPNQCVEPNAWCGAWGDGGLCMAAECVSNSACPAGAHCMGGRCTFPCVPPQTCPDPGYQCLDLADGFNRCLAPTCVSDADCPDAHRCSSDASGGSTCAPIGDPAMIYPVPVEQLRTSYVFLVPDGFVDDWATLYAPQGVSVMLDGKWIDEAAFEAIDDRFRMVSVSLEDGVHRIEADAPVGVIVYGFDDDVSYGYPAGTGLTELW